MLPDIVLIVLVLAFWGFAFARALAMNRRLSVNLWLSPVFFLVFGLLLNHYRVWWGTYVIGGIHVMLALLLLGLAVRRR